MSDPIVDELKRRNHDCPPCPKGCGSVGTPSSKTESGRWYGPDASRLWCPACGAGWYGTDAEFAQAEAAWAAYEMLCQMGVM
jgi:hypothetical protein